MIYEHFEKYRMTRCQLERNENGSADRRRKRSPFDHLG